MEVDIDEECRRIFGATSTRGQRPAFGHGPSVKPLPISKRVGDESKRIARLAIQLSETGEAPKGYVEVRHISENPVRQ